jgi:signal transduction histidine kinase
MPAVRNDIIIFLVITTIIILLLVGLIVLLIYLYQKKQLSHQRSLENIQLDHERNILSTKLEIQEETFQHIAREIHDNINLSLTLAKLHLNTLDLNNKEKAATQVTYSVDLLTQSISNLRDISKSLNSELVANQGLIKALDTEINRIRKTGLFEIDFEITGDPVYLDTQKELVIFRIIQEGFNNIIKHARATRSIIDLKFNDRSLVILLNDNGIGFNLSQEKPPVSSGKAGLANMMTRTQMIGGVMSIESATGKGSRLTFNIPI